MLGNWIRETTTTTGTGNLTISSVSGYPTFNTHFGTSARFKYAILDDSTGAPIEMGIGHLSASITLVRDWVLATYDSGTYAEPNAASGHVSLAAGTKRVICTPDQSELTTNPLASMIKNNATANQRIVMPDNYVSFVASGVTVTLNRLYCWPVRIQHRGTFDALCLRGSAAGANVDLALYRMLETGLPGAKVVGVTGVASASGMFFGSITAFALTPGWYVAAMNADNGTPTYYHGILNEGYGRTDVVTQLPMAYLTQTAGTLPDPFGAPTVIGNLAIVPAMGLRHV